MMTTESEKYSRGASGFGAPDYASPAWRAGDLERGCSYNLMWVFPVFVGPPSFHVP